MLCMTDGFRHEIWCLCHIYRIPSSTLMFQLRWDSFLSQIISSIFRNGKFESCIGHIFFGLNFSAKTQSLLVTTSWKTYLITDLIYANWNACAVCVTQWCKQNQSGRMIRVCSTSHEYDFLMATCTGCCCENFSLGPPAWAASTLSSQSNIYY